MVAAPFMTPDACMCSALLHKHVLEVSHVWTKPPTPHPTADLEDSYELVTQIVTGKAALTENLTFVRSTRISCKFRQTPGTS